MSGFHTNFQLSAFRPSDWQHVHYAVEAYQDNGGIILPDWELVSTPFKLEAVGFCAAAYIHKEKKHIIFAYRGTNNLQGLLVDLDTMTRHLNQQESIAWSDFAKKIIEQYGPEFTFSFAGHSLGGWLAQVCLWKYMDEFIKNSREGFQDGFAVTLDEPGSKDLLEALQPRVETGYRIDVAQLDITNYLSHPNIINTIAQHVGTVYALSPNISLSWLQWHTASHTRETHSAQKLLEQFSPETGLPDKCTRMLDWPKVCWGERLPSTNASKGALGYLWHMAKAYAAGDIRRGEYLGFYTFNAEQIAEQNLDAASQFRLTHGVHYRIDPRFNNRMLPLRNMPTCIRRFLEDLAPYPNRADVVRNSITAELDPEVAALLEIYSIDERDELSVQRSAGISARDFIEKIRVFLSNNVNLYKIKLPALLWQSIANRLDQLTTAMMPDLINTLQIQTSKTRELVYKLSARQGTARLYKFTKPSFDEIMRIQEEQGLITEQLSTVTLSQKRLQKLPVTDDNQALASRLELCAKQLKIAQMITDAMLSYMESNIEKSDNKLDELIAMLDMAGSDLDKNLLLNRAFNLKAKIAILKRGDWQKAEEYYKKAMNILPADVITKINYIGLLTDRARSEMNPSVLVIAYKLYQEAAVAFKQVPVEQITVAYSGVAYTLLLFAQNHEAIIRTWLFAPDELPTKNILFAQAAALLRQAILINPNYTNARIYMALLHFCQNKYAEALQEINNALSIDPNHPTALMRKGLILEKLGKKDEAVAYLNIARSVLERNNESGHNSSWIQEIDVRLAIIDARQPDEMLQSIKTFCPRFTYSRATLIGAGCLVLAVTIEAARQYYSGPRM